MTAPDPLSRISATYADEIKVSRADNGLWSSVYCSPWSNCSQNNQFSHGKYSNSNRS